MKKLITNLHTMFSPKIYGELYGRNKFNKINRFEIHRHDNTGPDQVFIEVFSQTNPKAKGAPLMLLLALEDAKLFHAELGKILNPSKKDLENGQD